MRLYDADPKTIKPGTRIEIVEHDDPQYLGQRGTITRVLLEERDEDRYDSYHILWDKGSASWGVFVTWCQRFEILDEIHPWWGKSGNDHEKFNELFELCMRDKLKEKDLFQFLGDEN